jgi:DNA segregation ATPase FtsK/SpoIIIE-like protein
MVEHKDFREVLNENNEKHKVVVGYKNNTKKIIDLKKNPSIIVTGETGSGKSILLDQIVCQLIKNNTSLDMDFFLIEFIQS